MVIVDRYIFISELRYMYIKYKCDAVTSSVIRDVLHMKYQHYYDQSQSFLSSACQ